MNTEHVHQVIFTEGLGDLLRDRVRESMCHQKKTGRDLGSQLSNEIGLKQSSVIHLVGNLRKFPSFVLPMSDNYVSVSPQESLRRVSLVLHALNFDANEEVILRLRRLYGNDFAYPPWKKIDIGQVEEAKNPWVDYI